MKDFNKKKEPLKVDFSHFDEEKAKMIFEALKTLGHDMREASKRATEEFDRKALKYIVGTYYRVQKVRKAIGEQIRSSEQKPHGLLVLFWRMHQLMEKETKRHLDHYTASDPVCTWARSQVGVDSIIAAGLAAEIDVTQTTCLSGVWKFAGMAPPKTYKRGKGHKREWSGSLKVVCYNLGCCIMKNSLRHPESKWSAIYRSRKEYETEKNERKEYYEQAREVVSDGFIKSKYALGYYKKDMLPPGHIDARARRYVVKIFLAEWFHQEYTAVFGEEPPKPYPIQHLGHVHWLKPEGTKPKRQRVSRYQAEPQKKKKKDNDKVEHMPKKKTKKEYKKSNNKKASKKRRKANKKKRKSA